MNYSLISNKNSLIVRIDMVDYILELKLAKFYF